MKAFSKESYEIYSNLIRHDYLKNIDLDKNTINLDIIILPDLPVLVENKTAIRNYFGSNEPEEESMNKNFEGFRKQFTNLKRETCDDFVLINRESEEIIHYFKVDMNVQVISSGILEEIFKSGGWQAFYDKYGRAQKILRFSRVGFDKERSQALVYNEIEYASQGGYGCYFFFEKKEEKWIETGSLPSWIK